MAMKFVTGITPRHVAALAVISVTCASPIYARQDSQDALLRFEEDIAERVERRGGAVSAAVVFGGDVVWAESFGWADVGQRTRTRVQTVFPTGSFSASLTVILLAMLDEQGVVQIDDPVVDYVPEFRRVRGPPEYVDVITLRQLAIHTSGLMPTPPLPYAVPGGDELWTSRTLSLVANTPLYYVPGERVTYSGVGLGILAVALARASSIPFNDLAAALIFRPLNLSYTSFDLTPAMARFSASANPSGILRDDIRGIPYRGVRGSVTVEAPGMHTTAEDLARILAGLFGSRRPQLLSTYGLSNVLNLSPAAGQYVEYDAGFTLESSEDAERIVGRGETLAGHSVYAIYSPDYDAGVILLANYRQATGEFEGSAAALLEQLIVNGTEYRSHAFEEAADAELWTFADVDQRPVRKSCELAQPHVGGDGNGGVNGDSDGNGGTNGGSHGTSAKGKARVTLEFIVGRDGKPELGSFLVVSANNQRYENSAVDWAYSCKFSPGKVAGQSVRVLVRQTVVF